MLGQADLDALVEGFKVQEQGLWSDPGDLAVADADGLLVQPGQGPADLLVPLLVGEILLGRGEFADQVGPHS